MGPGGRRRLGGRRSRKGQGQEELVSHSSEAHKAHKGSSSPPVPAKPNILYSRGSFVDIVCWTVG